MFSKSIIITNKLNIESSWIFVVNVNFQILQTKTQSGDEIAKCDLPAL